jgi:hypothetical protein
MTGGALVVVVLAEAADVEGEELYGAEIQRISFAARVLQLKFGFQASRLLALMLNLVAMDGQVSPA